MLAYYGMPGPMEIAIIVIMLGFIFVPIRWAFAKAGFRHPMLPTLPVGVAVWFASAFAVQVWGAGGLPVLPFLVVVLVVAISNTGKKAGNNDSDSADT